MCVKEREESRESEVTENGSLGKGTQGLCSPESRYGVLAIQGNGHRTVEYPVLSWPLRLFVLLVWSSTTGTVNYQPIID